MHLIVSLLMSGRHRRCPYFPMHSGYSWLNGPGSKADRDFGGKLPPALSFGCPNLFSAENAISDTGCRQHTNKTHLVYETEIQ